MEIEKDKFKMTIDIENIFALIGAIEQQKGKHVKYVLSKLEERGDLDPNIRKIVLDGFNNFNRSIQTLFNYRIED